MAYATLEDLQKRLDWTLDPDEERIAESALEDASIEARYHGRDWPEGSAPAMVRRLVLKACERYMRNPGGHNVSRAGDETVGWSDKVSEEAVSVEFTRDEIDLLRQLAGKSFGGLTSISVSAWGPQRKAPAGMVPVAGGDDPFPLYASEEDPW